ncbi:hypothetical protein D5S17_23615 [Pseudonocardiaceae bacterium YIM PH 21723]|nr:hypothetical protein D5S17_23615 [Pseudonocardiaceae bacterium YIM PH 21723]
MFRVGGGAGLLYVRISATFWIFWERWLWRARPVGGRVFPVCVLGGGTPAFWGWAASAGDLKDAIVYLSSQKASFVYLR